MIELSFSNNWAVDCETPARVDLNRDEMVSYVPNPEEHRIINRPSAIQIRVIEHFQTSPNEVDQYSPEARQAFPQMRSGTLDRYDIKKPTIIRRRSENDDEFSLLRKYEGHVLSVDKQTFWARLWEDFGNIPAIEAEFDLEELSESDRGIAIEGASIVWTIGYATQFGARRRESIMYVRRLPPITQHELEKSKTEVEDLMREISWEQ